VRYLYSIGWGSAFGFFVFGITIMLGQHFFNTAHYSEVVNRSILGIGSLVGMMASAWGAVFYYAECWEDRHG
jgi:hypothetical protein